MQSYGIKIVAQIAHETIENNILFDTNEKECDKAFELIKQEVITKLGVKRFKEVRLKQNITSMQNYLRLRLGNPKFESFMESLGDNPTIKEMYNATVNLLGSEMVLSDIVEPKFEYVSISNNHTIVQKFQTNRITFKKAKATKEGIKFFGTQNENTFILEV